jgi:SpoVK/Ycf46/Vps4 family AAA+-type ATPase
VKRSRVIFTSCTTRNEDGQFPQPPLAYYAQAGSLLARAMNVPLARERESHVARQRGQRHRHVTEPRQSFILPTMPSADQIKALVRSHLEKNDTQFVSVAMQIAAYEARRGHTKLAEELRALIDEVKAKQNPFPAPSRTPIPISKPRGELSSLVASSFPTQRLSDIVVSRQVGGRLDRIIKEQRHFARIRDHGLSPRRKLLLVGPPGTGKTLTASVLSGELGLPLFQVRLDGLISKFMGETAAKLRLIFDAIMEHRAVYFFDEFDAIASQRGLGNDVGEIRRVLNSFLQFIEQDESNSLIVAATNHPEILDHAVFRRFDDVIEYQLPDQAQIEETLRARIGDMGAADIPWATVSTSARGLSYADITRAADEAVKEAIITDQRAVTQQDLLRALGERLAIQHRQRTASPQRDTTEP